MYIISTHIYFLATVTCGFKNIVSKGGLVLFQWQHCQLVTQFDVAC